MGSRRTLEKGCKVREFPKCHNRVRAKTLNSLNVDLSYVFRTLKSSLNSFIFESRFFQGSWCFLSRKRTKMPHKYYIFALVLICYPPAAARTLYNIPRLLRHDDSHKPINYLWLRQKWGCHTSHNLAQP